MNKTQRNIYRQHGIETDGDKLVTPAGLRMPEPLTHGNTKTGPVWTWSTLPGNGTFETSFGTVCGTCKCNCPGCYAQTGFYLFKSTRDALAIRTITAETFPVWIMEAISAQLEYIEQTSPDPVRVRISAAGDVTDTMAPVWSEIVRRFPGVVFWTYTKNDNFAHAFDDVDNANIVSSIVPGVGYNFGPIVHVLRAYVHLVDNGETPYICRCGIDPEQHCHDCGGCSNHKFVLFIEHSTAYKAEQDPLYKLVVAVIELQAILPADDIARYIRAQVAAL